MQDMKLVCTLDGAEYKEYEFLVNEQPFGIISWKCTADIPQGHWYITASDGNPRYFHTKQEAIEFLTNNPLKSANDLSARLKAEASKLVDIAEEIETKSAEA